MTGAMIPAMTDEERTAEIARLERLLSASQGQEGYAQRVEAIKSKLEELRNAE